MSNHNETNSHERDSRISFEPLAHKYNVNGDGCYDSVTAVIADYFEKFDADYWAERKATPTCSAEMLKKQWQEKAEAAAARGTQMHERIEKFYLGVEPDESALADVSFRQFLDFTKEYSLHPYRTEWTLYSEEHRIAGTLDFLDYTDGVFRIFDWKRSTKVVDNAGLPLLNNYGKFGHGPLCSVPDTSFHHYALQQSMYRYILATKYDIEVSGCYLGIFHEKMSRFHVVEVPYLLDEINALLDDRL